MIQEFAKDEAFIELCNSLEQVIERYLGDKCLGFYIFGSAITNMFRKNSDIDFLCLTSDPIDLTMLEMIKDIHNSVQGNCFSHLLEGEYHFVSPEKCFETHKIIEVHRGKDPFVDIGTLDPDVVEMIKRSCKIVYGKKPQDTFPYFTTNDLILYFQRYLEHIYKKSINIKREIHILLGDVLNACRAYYCIVNNNYIPDKEIAAIWAIGRFPKYKSVIDTARLFRNGEDGQELDEIEIVTIQHLFHDMISHSNNPEEKVGFLMPMRTEIQVNTSCNCCCPHCGYDTVGVSGKGEMSIQTIMSYLNEVKDCWGWIDRVLFEGGEATLSFEKLMQCIKYAKSLHIPNIQLNTNLSVVSVDMCEKLILAGCNYFEISVDAISKRNWLKMRGLDKNEKKDLWYDNFRINLDFLSKYPGVQVDFNFTPTSLNISEIEEVYKYACESGVAFFSFQNLICTSDDNTAVALSKDEIMESISKCINIAQKYANPTTILLCCTETLCIPASEYDDYKYISFLHCDSGERYVYINHKQELRKCCFGSGGFIGVYEKGRFANLWKNRHCPSGCMFVR